MPRPHCKPYPLPLESHTIRMDAAAWAMPLLDVEPGLFGAQIALKEAILAGDSAYYSQCLPDAESLAWEALELLLVGAARDWPEHFRLDWAGVCWTWENRLRGETTRFRPGDDGTLPRPPLDWLGRQFQEDLILMAADEDGEAVCVAGTLCFGSGWCLGDKIGKSFLEVHTPVPGFAAGPGAASDLLLRRLKPARPVGRWNWTLPATGRLNLAPALVREWAGEREGVTRDNAGVRCFLRTERQTLSRLPRPLGGGGGLVHGPHLFDAGCGDCRRPGRCRAAAGPYPQPRARDSRVPGHDQLCRRLDWLLGERGAFPRRLKPRQQVHETCLRRFRV